MAWKRCMHCGRLNKPSAQRCSNNNCLSNSAQDLAGQPVELLARKEFESAKEDVWYKKRMVYRSICYASLIYQHATNSKLIDRQFPLVEQLVYSAPTRPKTKCEVLETGGRSYTSQTVTIKDNDVGWAVISLKIPNEHGQENEQVYVVFRGSRGFFKPGKRYTDGLMPHRTDKENNGIVFNETGAGWADELVEQVESGSEIISHVNGDTKKFNHNRFKRLNVDWHANYDNMQVAWNRLDDRRQKVHRGFTVLYESMRSSIVAKLKPNAQIIVCGHSLGAALAILCAADLKKNYAADTLCVALSPPRAGNYFFAKSFNNSFNCTTNTVDGEEVYRAYNIANAKDPIANGGKYSFKYRLPFDSDFAEKSTLIQGLPFKLKTLDHSQRFYHCGRLYRIGKNIGMVAAHNYTQLMDAIMSGGSAARLNFCHTR